jgi:hypothetical protein
VSFEDVREVSLVIKSSRCRDCRKGFVGPGQFFAGGLNPEAAEVFADRATVVLSEGACQMTNMHVDGLGERGEGNLLGAAILEDVVHPPKPKGRHSGGLSHSGATGLNQHFQDVGLDCQVRGRVRHAEFFVKPEAAASQWASQEVGRLMKDPHMLNDCGQSLGRDFHAEVAGASRRDMAGVDFSIRVKNYVSRRATPHAPFIRLYVFPIQHNAEMRVGVDMLGYARTRGEMALGEPKPRHLAHMNLAAVEFP